MTLLKVENISKSFKALKVLDNVSVSLHENERHVIIGPNGAGKTTLFHCIAGTIPMNQGKIFIDGKDVSRTAGHERVFSGMARTFQKNNLFNKLSVEENIHLAISAMKPYRRRMFKSFLSYKDLHEESQKLMERWGIWDKRQIIVDELSYGEQRILEIVLALASKPRILLLDEPTSGMSPAETVQTMELIQQFPKSISLLMIEHDMEVVFSIAERISVLHHGKVLVSGTPEEIRENDYVREIYFGGGALVT